MLLKLESPAPPYLPKLLRQTAKPSAFMRPITSRPLLLAAVGRANRQLGYRPRGYCWIWGDAPARCHCQHGGFGRVKAAEGR